MKEKPCAFVAGDKTIIYPAIICLACVSKYNDFDLYIFTEKSFVTEEHLKVSNKYGIKIVDLSEINNDNIITHFSGSSNWSVSSYYNYLAPQYLYDLGYEFALKLDYDILCMKKYLLTDMLPKDKEILACCYNGPLKNYGSPDAFEKIQAALKMDINVDQYAYVHTGVIGINLQAYQENHILDTLISVDDKLCNIWPSTQVTPLREQLALSLVQPFINCNFKSLPPMYAFRPVGYGLCSAEVYNIHLLWLKNPSCIILLHKYFIPEFDRSKVYPGI